MDRRNGYAPVLWNCGHYRRRECTLGDGKYVHSLKRDIPDEEEVLKMSSVMGQPNEDEWSSEGVQIGGPGSAAGVLGLWTGAGHDNDDPLGT